MSENQYQLETILLTELPLQKNGKLTRLGFQLRGIAEPLVLVARGDGEGGPILALLVKVRANRLRVVPLGGSEDDVSTLQKLLLKHAYQLFEVECSEVVVEE
jgi:hypothetical protein